MSALGTVTAVPLRLLRMADKIWYMIAMFGPIYVLIAMASVFLGGFGRFGLEIAWFPTTWEGFAAGAFGLVMMFMGGMMAVTIAIEYKNNEKSVLYHMAVLFGLFHAIVIMLTIAIMYLMDAWSNVLIMLMGIMAFAMAFRPFIKFNVSFAIAGLVGVIAYYGVYLFFPGFVDTVGIPGLVLLSGITFIFLWLVLGFAESGLEAVAKILNAWPILTILGALCMLEAALTYFGFPLLGGF